MDPITLATIGTLVLAPISIVASFTMLALGVHDRTTYTLNPPSLIANTAGTLTTGCGSADPYLELINEAAIQYNIEPAWIAGVIEQESHGNPTAESRGVGALGLMQLMPDTFAQVRSTPVSVGRTGDSQGKTAIASKNRAGKTLPAEAFDAEANIYAGTHYLRQNYNAFHNLRFVLAAYNAGPGAIQRYSGPPPYKETAYYINRIAGEPGKSDSGFIAMYRKCLKATSTATAVSSNIGEVTPAVKRVLDYIATHPNESCQFTNPAFTYQRERQIGCAKTVEGVLKATFPGTNPTDQAANPWLGKRNVSRHAPPSSQDLDQAKAVLARGNIPVWHINGNASGEHWIGILKITNDSTIFYYDPADGQVKGEPATKSANLGPYFGITPQGSTANEQFNRGYEFTAQGH